MKYSIMGYIKKNAQTQPKIIIIKTKNKQKKTHEKKTTKKTQQKPNKNTPSKT